MMVRNVRVSWVSWVRCLRRGSSITTALDMTRGRLVVLLQQVKICFRQGGLEWGGVLYFAVILVS
jgi:hypothetical protein